MKKLLLISMLFSCVSFSSNGQILISLLLGDKVNSDSLEFGLVGGINMTETSGLENSKMMGEWNLGFYFDFMITDKWSFTPACLVKASVGAKSLSPYALGENYLDSVMVGGEVRRNLGYFQVPLMMKYKIIPRIHVAIGPQLSLLHSATDLFTNDVISSNDVAFKNDIKKQYKRLDAGVIAGIGWALKKEKKSMNLGVKYYQGMVNVVKDKSLHKQKNNSIYFYITIPIGAGKNKGKDTSPGN